MFTIIELEPSQCRYPITDKPPHFFCGEATDGRSYCPEHDAVCHSGKLPKPWQALAGMMEATEQTIVRGKSREEHPVEADSVLRSAEHRFDKPLGLMGRT